MGTIRKLNVYFSTRRHSFWLTLGEDALQYLRFQRYVIGYLMFVMVICISVILPLNFMGGLQGEVWFRDAAFKL